MSRTAVVTLCPLGLKIARAIVRDLDRCDLFAHSDISRSSAVTSFDWLLDVTAGLFESHGKIVFVLPTGVAVRAIAPHAKHKKSDPAVVVVDVGGRWAISLLSGHEGGANELAIDVANILGAEPVITTTTETEKSLIVGVGCRRDVEEEVVTKAIVESLEHIGRRLDEVRLLASVDLKRTELGLLQGARTLGIPIRFISSWEIRNSPREFEHNEVSARRVDLPAVAEAAALLAGRRTTLILPKQKKNGMTVAIAEESFTS